MTHRITNGMMIDTFTRNLTRNQNRMDKYMNQLAANRKIVRLSDDPVGVVKSINARSKLNDIEQYKRNVSDASAWMTATETALDEANTIIKRGIELATQAANEVNSKDELEAISYEIAQLRDQLVQIGNATIGDKFIFGGFNVSRAPFKVVQEDGSELTPGYDGARRLELDGSGTILYDMVKDAYNTPASTPAPGASNVVDADRTLNYEIGFDIYMDIGVGPVTMMGAGEQNLFKIFDDMTSILRDKISNVVDKDGTGFGTDGNNVVDGTIKFDTSDNAIDYQGNEALRQYMAKLQTAQSRNLATIADLGGRQNRLDLVTERYGQDTINYTKMMSDVEDLDQEEAIMNFSMMNAVYQASLAVGAKVIQPTLVDFLR